MMRRTLLDFFADVTGGSAAHAQFLAYDDGYRAWTWTYGETAAAARAFAQRLRGHGIAGGQAIAIWSENRPEWIAAMWGALLEGVVIVPIDYRTSADFLLKVAGIVDAKAIVVGDAVDTSHLGDARPVWRLPEIFRLKPEATSDLNQRLQATRKPIPYEYVSGGTLWRWLHDSIRTSATSQLPPRNKRKCPSGGPVGLRAPAVP
jgi:acyl-CoA synthetase (AMP-forming)/AMP-acid ligase II